MTIRNDKQRIVRPAHPGEMLREDFPPDYDLSVSSFAKVGESGVVCIAPAVGNALYRATGVRIRKQPLAPERVRRARRDPQRGG
jgi:hypothetical protein